MRQPRWQREFRWDHRPDPDATIQIKSLPLEPFRESIPVELLRQFSFVRPPAQPAHGDGKGAKLAPVLFLLFPYFKFYSRLTNSHVLLHCCRNPFCGPALLAAFHKWFPANDKQDLWKNRKQIRRNIFHLLTDSP